MIRHRSGFLALVLLAAALTALAAAPAARAAGLRHAVYLDTSGSMAGFGKAPLWSEFLNEMEAGATRTRSFGSKAYQPKGPLAREELNQSGTDLAVALRDWLDTSKPGDAAVFITDNVADDRNANAAAAQRRFYALLQDRRDVTQVSLIPALLPFNGTVMEPGRDSNRSQYPAGKHQFADRAVALYLLVREAGSDGAMRALEARTTDLLRKHKIPHELLRIAPFGIAGWNSSVSTDVTLSGDSAAGVKATMDPDWGLVIPGFPLGQPLKLSFVAEVRPGPNFLLKDAALDAVIRLDEGEFLASSRLVSAQVAPYRADLHPERLQRFDVTFDIAPIDFFRHVPMATKIKLAFSNSTVVKGEIAINFAVRREQVFLAGDTAAKWSYDGAPEALARPDPAVQARIYHLQDLVRGMLPEEQLTRAMLTRAIWLELRYPAGPVMALLLAAAVMVVPLLLVLRRFVQPRHYLALDYGDGQGQPITPGFLSPSAATSADGHCQIRVRWIGFGLLVASSARLLGGRFLDLGGGTVRVEGHDGEQRATYTFRITPLGAGGAGEGIDDW